MYKIFRARHGQDSLLKTVAGFFYPGEWICIAFFIVSWLRLSFESIALPKSVLDDLIFVPMAILTVKFFRGYKIQLYFLLAALIAAFYFKSARAFILPPFGLIVFYLLLKRAELSSLFRQIRIALPLSLMTLLYPFVPMLISAASRPDQDRVLQHMDEVLFFGHSPQLIAQATITPWLSEWMAFTYSSYAFILLFIFVLLYLRNDLRAFKEYVWMSTFVLAVGYTFYSLVPAQGPVFTQHFDVSLDLYYMKYIKDALMDRTRIERDCFPSLHTAVSLICLFIAWKHERKYFWLILPLVVSIPFACVYLRYHYVTDILAGMALAALTIAISIYGSKASFRRPPQSEAQTG
jgi:membrane-associated phospholipid phosphatase